MKKLYTLDLAKQVLKGAWKTATLSLLLILNISGLYAQTTPAPANPSGEWSSYVNMGANSTKDWGNGVIQLLNAGAGNVGVALLSNNSQYNSSQTSVTWSHCYYVYFGCQENNGDGISFSFYNNADTYTSNGNAMGGGLGYMNAINKMITIEFDTYNSACSDGYFDCTFAGVPQSGGTVTTGNADEIAISFDGDARSASGSSGLMNVGGIVGSVNVGQLEDDEEHLVCITYTPGVNSGKLKVTIDGVQRINYELGATYNFNAYFGGGTLNQAWGSGQNGALVKGAVSDGTHTIASQLALVPGAVLDPACAVLPVTWLSFTGEKMAGAVLLNWATAIEKNNEKFIVERSAAGTDWQAIGQVAGAGNASFNKNYSFTDVAPLEGLVYYRIRQVDFDGKYDFSSVVAIQQTGEQSISIAPNPFSDALTIRSNIKGEIGIKIHDILGRLVYQSTKETSDGILTIYPELLSGSYVITIQTDTFIEQQKIIKN